MSEWQPIETIPDDRTVMLGCWYVDEAGGYYGESRWLWMMAGSKDIDGVAGTWWSEFEDDYVTLTGYQRPTHWREIDWSAP